MIVANIIGIICSFSSFWPSHLGFLTLCSSDSANRHPLDVSALGILCEYWIEHVTCGPICVMLRFSTYIFHRGSSRLCNWLSLRCLMPWINHYYPVSRSIFRKSSLIWKRVCKMVIIENDFFIVYDYVLYIYLYVFTSIAKSSDRILLYSFTVFSRLK